MSQTRQKYPNVEGDLKPADFRAVCEQYGYRCLCCHATENISVDHIRPLSWGGRNDKENIQPLCKPCNSRKSDKWVDFRSGKTQCFPVGKPYGELSLADIVDIRRRYWEGQTTSEIQKHYPVASTTMIGGIGKGDQWGWVADNWEELPMKRSDAKLLPRSVRLTPEEDEWFNREAYRRSRPGRPVSVHSLMKEAIQRFIEQEKRGLSDA